MAGGQRVLLFTWKGWLPKRPVPHYVALHASPRPGRGVSYGSISTDTAVDPHNLHWSLKVSGFKLFNLFNLFNRVFAFCFKAFLTISLRKVWHKCFFLQLLETICVDITRVFFHKHALSRQRKCVSNVQQLTFEITYLTIFQVSCPLQTWCLSKQDVSPSTKNSLTNP